MDFPPPKPLAIFRGGSHPRQYHLGDMARDTVGLLDVLGYRDVHLAGISMGGMIGADRRGALSRPGAHTDVDHVHHGRCPSRQACAFDLVAVGDGKAATYPRRGDGARL